jgi:glutamyl-Q tRNA(Asp) synthetase
VTAGPARSSAPVAPYVGRFAPSPTGPLHFGSLVAAAASYADARAVGGRWLLRIEDLDPPREQPGAIASILQTLETYGFEWDGPVCYQSRRDAAYAQALQRLRDERKVFACACTRQELARGTIGVGGERVYPGTCRDGVQPGRSGRAWRLRVDGEPIEFVDRVQGPQRQILSRDVGDFVVRRADGHWAYQLAVVVDDAESGITDVVRGSDLLASTPRQIWLQRQLGYPTPRYAHVPVAASTKGEKLSKQTLAPALPEERIAATLLAAWRFLEQATDDESEALEFGSARAFWAYAIPRWNARRVPPVPSLPAPAFGRGDRPLAL